MKNTPKTQQLKPWYREPWLWFILAPLITVVIASTVMVTIAIYSQDDVISDNYYREGRMLAQEFTSERYAKSIDLSGDIKFDMDVGEVLLTLNKASESNNIELLISHPAKAEFDKTLSFRHLVGATYAAELSEALQGRWYLRLVAKSENVPATNSALENHALTQPASANSGPSKSSEIWRLHGEIDFTSSQIAELE